MDQPLDGDPGLGVTNVHQREIPTEYLVRSEQFPSIQHGVVRYRRSKPKLLLKIEQIFADAAPNHDDVSSLKERRDPI